MVLTIVTEPAMAATNVTLAAMDAVPTATNVTLTATDVALVAMNEAPTATN